jgi:hypothetical protein
MEWDDLGAVCVTAEVPAIPQTHYPIVIASVRADNEPAIPWVFLRPLEPALSLRQSQYKNSEKAPSILIWSDLLFEAPLVAGADQARPTI